MNKKKIAIIGCGISAVSFYYFLNKDKFDVTFFEKSRGVGGRMSAKRVGNLNFDHGASCYGAIRSKKFQEFVKQYIEKDIIKVWQGNFYYLDLVTGEKTDQEQKTRLISAQKSNFFVKELLKDALENNKIKFQEKVTKLDFINEKISITTESNNIYNDFDIVISSAPAPQTLQIFPKEFCFRKIVEQVEYESTFVLMLSLTKSDKVNFSHLALKNSIISRISYENSKADRDFDVDCFVINACNLYSERLIDQDPEIIKQELINEFIKITNLDRNNIKDAILHRWLYANAKKSYDLPPLFDDKLKIGAIGDYIKHPRIETAFESGLEMAEIINYEYCSLVDLDIS